MTGELARFLFTTAEGLFLLALSTGTPVVFTLLSRRTLRSTHAMVNGILFIVFAVPAAFALSIVEPGSGMGGGLFLIAGVGAGAIALAFLVATLATVLVLVLRDEDDSPTLRGRSSVEGREPSSPALQEQYTRWKAAYRRPTATYQEFLEQAHPRYFPASPRVWIGVAIAMVILGFLLIR